MRLIKHWVRLWNDKMLVIEEGDNSLSIASVVDGEVDYYLCQINGDGVLCYSTPPYAVQILVDGLKENPGKAITENAETCDTITDAQASEICGLSDNLSKDIADSAPCSMPCNACIYEFDLRHPQIPQLHLDSARMILCEHCGNKRCPHASDHRLACTNSNEPGQPGSIYERIED
jgi:hypothetical protein